MGAMTSTPDLAAELASLGRRLDSVEARLQAFGVPEAQPSTPTGADAPATAGVDAVTSVLERPAAPSWGPSPQAPAWGPPTGAPAWGPPTGPGAPSWAPRNQAQNQNRPAPWSTGLPAGWGHPPVAPGAPAPASRATAGGAKLLAWTGGAMTLLGVVLFLALAASRGWGSPAARVWSGAVLGVVLVAFGTWMHRVETRRGGALAVAGTGFAALYLVVAAANRLLGLVEPVAVLLALVVAAAGLALADRWRSALLASGIVVGGAVLAPVLVEGPLLVALLLALQVAVAVVALRRGWSWPALLAAAGPALTASVVVFDSDPWRILAVLATTLLGLAGAAIAVRRLPDGVVGGLVALAVLPALVLGPEVDGWGGAGIAAAAGLLALALLAVPGVGARLRTALVAVAAVAVLEAVLVALDGPVATGTLLVVAVALAGTAVAVRDRLPLVVAGGFWLVGTLLAIAVDAPVTALIDFPQYPYLADGRGQTAEIVGGTVVSLLVLLASVALTVAGGRLRLVRPDSATAGIWVPLGIAGLYGTAGLIVSLALLVSPERTAFTVGHAIVTVSWTVVALVLLARGLRRPALRVTGLVLVAGAVAKLVLFDLVVLDGLAQVAAFLGAGLVLLAAGTRYARMVAEAGQPGQAGPRAG